MRNLPVFLIVVAAISLQPSLAAETAEEAVELVERGIAAYVNEGATAALTEWMRGSALEANPQAMTQANSLRQIEDFYGKPLGFDLVKEATITPRAKTVYFAVNYERGVAFAKLNAYRNEEGTWIVTSFFFHTEAAQVFPSSLLGQ
jgi:hypothetical protein